VTQLLANRVAIVTGAGRGLGRSHALALARHGAKVVVSDLDLTAAKAVSAEIQAAGGEAMANATNVQDLPLVEAMVSETLSRWGHIDILVNNAGLLRDKTFAKQELADFRLVLEVHLMGSVHCTRAVWPHMRDRGYGRIVFTTSSSGLYGNFGQAAYSAAKMGLVGLMQTLALEGQRNGIHVNCLAPSAATHMTDGLLPKEDLAAMSPDRVSPAVVALASEHAPTRRIVLAGAGSFEQANITMTQGVYLGGREDAAEKLLESWQQLADRTGEFIPATGFEQYQFEVGRARANPAAAPNAPASSRKQND
jgi:NAD(P)-dependent dehydrogenase (short-subunit alcohol dehydrogenase family)